MHFNGQYIPYLDIRSHGWQHGRYVVIAQPSWPAEAATLDTRLNLGYEDKAAAFLRRSEQWQQHNDATLDSLLVPSIYCSPEDWLRGIHSWQQTTQQNYRQSQPPLLRLEHIATRNGHHPVRAIAAGLVLETLTGPHDLFWRMQEQAREPNLQRTLAMLQQPVQRFGGITEMFALHETIFRSGRRLS